MMVTVNINGQVLAGLVFETAVSPVRRPIAMVVVGGAAPPGSVPGGLEFGGRTDPIVGSDADY